jgi:hypothetical protein
MEAKRTNWDDGERHSAPRLKHKKLPHVAQHKDEHTPSNVLRDPRVRVARECNGAVVPPRHEQLNWLEKVHGESPDEPDGEPRLVLVLVHGAVPQRLGVALHQAVVVQVRVAVRHVGVRVVPNHVLVVPARVRAQRVGCGRVGK